MVSPAGLVAESHRSSLLRARHEVMAQAVEPLHFSWTVLQRQTTAEQACIPAVFACTPFPCAPSTKSFCHCPCPTGLEVIPPEAVEAVLPAAALGTLPAEKADIKKRLVMLKQRQSTTAVRQASGRRRGSHVEMPSAINKVSPTLRDGALLCARAGCVEGTTQPQSAERSAG